ncbi:hypothetical protein BAUCODRAFT_36255 [Baudoinia panamericana UAMH 10762]|uniref:RING-type E3 ubiquitin transferase n=1 Tax=Baudoinia panamericana (strain UAMH 10762) TaxID=717646 RepID=M2LHZ5_BAUPA|nr:uncharacterized protein BAUCODRAFT_36255 [Baudoinia panamericana UAMH 10762]EMC93802.1 hypothetical protein BAUCODRAFT_36255 [Baudoinia panamericana UAMH 10762]
MADVNHAEPGPEPELSHPITQPIPTPHRRNTAASSTSGADTCRICRSEATPTEPLFHPCKCSGSIKHVHQECLMEWLSHSHKKHCELCHTPFRFTKLYDAHMPETLPWFVFLRQAGVHGVRMLLGLARGVLVGCVWLGVLPWLIRWSWRWMFWVADAGWAREVWLSRRRREGAGWEESMARVNETDYNLFGLSETFSKFLNITINAQVDEAGPAVYNWLKDNLITAITSHNPQPAAPTSASANPEAASSLLSNVTYLSNLTSSPALNRLILDIMEGQLITCVVITGFILVFLIREWVVQQQPLVALEGLGQVQQQLREAAERVEAENERLRRQQELLEQARRRLMELKEETDAFNTGNTDHEGEGGSEEFIGWEGLEGLIEEATAYLRQSSSGQDDSNAWESAFRAAAEATMHQIRVAGRRGVDATELADHITGQLATFPPEQRGRWEDLLVEEVGRLGERTRGQTETEMEEEMVTEMEEERVGVVSEQNGSVKESDESVGLPKRPRMPERDFSSRATHIQRLLEEAEGIFSPNSTSNSREGGRVAINERQDGVIAGPSQDQLLQLQLPHHGSFPPSNSDNINDAVSSPPNTQKSAVEDEDDYELPITNAGPDAKINIRRSGKGKARLAVPEPEIAPREREDQEKRRMEDEAMRRLEEEIKVEDAVAAVEEKRKTERETLEVAEAGAGNPFHPDGPEPERRGEGQMADGREAAIVAEPEGGADGEWVDIPETDPDNNAAGEAEEVDAEEEDDAQEPRPPPPQPTPFQRLADWFWADIQPQNAPDNAPPPPPNEERAVEADGEAAAFLPGALPPPAGAAALPAAALDAPDPEVLAAAQQAGALDPDGGAIDPELEDLEGIFELVGLQGPLLGLLQTSTFASVLVTGTVFGAVGLPYMWGKLVLSFLANPWTILVKAPFRLVSWVADFAVDMALLVGGWTVVGSLFTVNCVFEVVGLVLEFAAGWETGLGQGSKYGVWLAQVAMQTAGKAGVRLEELLFGADTAVESVGKEVGVNWAFLAASVHAHASLREIQGDVRAVVDWTGRGITVMVEMISSGSASGVWQQAKDLPAQVFHALVAVGRYWEPLLRSLGLLSPGVAGSSSATSLDADLVYWSTTDRTLTVAIGYLSLALLAALYVALDTPLARTEAGRKTEKAVRDTLRQAGGVLKVILIISIEMLVFPFYCGVLLDVAFLPLFKNATVAGRWQFARERPWMFCFVHWFMGTCYMFHFALFVGMCRKILRKGVLWFIRDPDDPTFHPVRDVLERNVTTQLRKIAFSALVYGALVILCLGGVIWSIGRLVKGIFPIHWVSTEPVLEFPMDLLLYNAVTPVVLRVLQPSEAVSAMYAWWLRRCARVLRLSHFLFDDRRKDEEGHFVRKSWKSFLLREKGEVDESPAVGGPKGRKMAVDLFGQQEHSMQAREATVRFCRDGKYVLTPCNDQYRPPKPGEAFLHSSDQDGDVYIADAEGKRNDHFAKVYVPPFFRLRITVFMVGLWMFSVALGLCGTLVPLVVGRKMMGQVMQGARINDIYAYSAGAYVLGGLMYGVLRGRRVVSWVTRKAKTQPAMRVDSKAALEKARSWTVRALKCAYVYGFIALILPMIFALVLQFYFILPLHTYTHSVLSTTASNSSGKITNATATAMSSSTFIPPPSPLHPPTLAHHTIHLLQDYCLGLLYVRLGIRFIVHTPASRPAEAIRRITADGTFNPNIALATRFLVLPITILSANALLVPPLLVRISISTKQIFLSHTLAWLAEPETQAKLYRYSYPMFAALLVLLLCGSQMLKGVGRWRARVRDEVYLVGERLHNFGEKKPPAGSRSVVRRER